MLILKQKIELMVPIQSDRDPSQGLILGGGSGGSKTKTFCGPRLEVCDSFLGIFEIRKLGPMCNLGVCPGTVN